MNVDIILRLNILHDSSGFSLKLLRWMLNAEGDIYTSFICEQKGKYKFLYLSFTTNNHLVNIYTMLYTQKTK